MANDLYTLEALASRLGNLPLSTLKHRVQQLGLQAAARGPRNKLLFDPTALEQLAAASVLLRDGHDLQAVRRQLGLAPAPDAESTPGEAAIAPLDRLARALEATLSQLAAKDQLLLALHEELRRAQETAATYQQKTFYLQSELQRMQGELRASRKLERPEPTMPGTGLTLGPLPWRRLWTKDET